MSVLDLQILFLFKCLSMKYDLQDPNDIAQLRGDFENISEEEWDLYIELAESEEYRSGFSKQDRSCLFKMKNSAGNSRFLSDKQINWGLSLVEKIEKLKEQEERNINAINNGIEQLNKRPKHVTFRVAWHDNKWDGTICKDPLGNRYCDGFHTLLAERLRKRKEKNIDNEIKYKGKEITTEYIPPCFWGVNVFGKKKLEVLHDNPAEPRLNHITEELPPFSIFSWPFAVSFTRDNSTYKIDGAYPKNLEEVRIPKFQSKISRGKSVAFIYTKFSNPFTEEEQQYLVVGCGLVTDKGDYTYFEPKSIIDEKRNSNNTKYRNFPSINWALRYSFEDENMLLRMPYHEYLDYIEQNNVNLESKQDYLDKIKVAITEPELEHCFKYVAMDVDEDEAIYILSKMRQKLLDCKDDNIVPVEEMNKKIRIVDELLSHVWLERSTFPGFSSISRHLLNWDKQEFLLDELIYELQENEGLEYADKFIELIKSPKSDEFYKKYSSLIEDVKSNYQDNLGISDDQFLNLCLLNLKPFQFNRVLRGKLRLSGDWKKDIEDELSSHRIDEISNNPYLLAEDYCPYESLMDEVTGEELDGAIDLFKIDIAYFPDVRFDVKRIDLQRQMKNTDKRRLRAIIIRYLKSLENNGHCFALSDEVETAIKQYPLFYNIGNEYTIPSKFFETLPDNYIIHFEEDENKIKVVTENETNYFYLYKVYNAEIYVSDIVQRLLQERINNEFYHNYENYIDKSIKNLSKKLGSHFEENTFRTERLELYSNIYSHKLFVLAGSPGSGKSYELLNIITNLEENGQRCLLLAPTGKAALRLKNDSDFPNIESFTIDKFIADVYSNRISRATINRYNNIIIDEMSMVDLMKFQKLLRLININTPNFKRLILVGDPHQLPAIGYGKVLRDIIYYLKSNKNTQSALIELQTNCRLEHAESKILEFSEGFISDGDLSQELKNSVVSQEDVSPGFRIQFWEKKNDLIKLLNSEFDNLVSRHSGNREEKLNGLFGLNSDGSFNENKRVNLENFQILTPYKSDYFGTNDINEYIQQVYKDNSELEFVNDWFKQSDKIIRTKNYYKSNRLILSNGSIGLIRSDKEPLLHFLESEEPIPITGSDKIRSSELEHFDLAYAITVHKSQGSGFNHVFLILPQKYGLLSRELVYTALTRSRESITIFIQGENTQVFENTVFEKARMRSYTESRKTSLLLDKPFRYYALEVDGYYLASRVEMLIYQVLKSKVSELGSDKFSFVYEVKPKIDGIELPMKTDFTLYIEDKIWYWEHLGRLGNKKYEWTWHNVKRPTYIEHNAHNYLITSHELSGINPDKIEQIVSLIINGTIQTEDKTNRYSLHHYSLR